MNEHLVNALEQQVFALEQATRPDGTDLLTDSGFRKMQKEVHSLRFRLDPSIAPLKSRDGSYAKHRADFRAAHRLL